MCAWEDGFPGANGILLLSDPQKGSASLCLRPFELFEVDVVVVESCPHILLLTTFCPEPNYPLGRPS
jgi:hypothetical protein